MADLSPTPEITPEPPESISPPPVTTYISKPKSSLGPILLGFFLVIFLAGIAGVVYFQAKFSSTPTPSPTPIATPSPEPSLEPSATPSASPKSSLKPVSAIKPIASVKPTPLDLPTLDFRFGNPSANVKQTYDDGSGDGRVINREYTSIQAGQFDEVPTLWSPRVTVCYHLVANEDVPGKNIKFSFSLDDKIDVEDNFGGFDVFVAGRLYDWCHDVTTSIGKHTARLTLNPDKSVKESNYTNDLGRVDWENLADKIAPNFTLLGPTNETAETNGTCFTASYLNDNVTSVANLKMEVQTDGGDWQVTQSVKYCLRGTTESSHSMGFRVTDARGNVNTQSKTFNLF